MPDPDVMPKHHAMFLAPGEEFVFIRPHAEFGTAIGEVVLGGSPSWVVARIQAGVVGDGAELADVRVHDVATVAQVGIVAYGGGNDLRLRADLGPCAKGAVTDLGRGVDA